MKCISNLMRSCYERIFGVGELEEEIDERVQLRERIGKVVDEHRILLNYAYVTRVAMLEH